MIGFLFFTKINYSQAIENNENVNFENEKKIDYALFYSDTCPHCHAEIQFINKVLMTEKYEKYLNFKFYNIYDEKTKEIMTEYSYNFKVDIKGVPIAFIADKVISGFGTEDTTGKDILKIIDKKIAEIEKQNQEEINSSLTASSSINTSTSSSIVCDDEKMIEIPFLGTIYLKDFSLPVLTLIIGLLDGFNPCAMWVLLFLITLLLGMEDKKKMLILGSLFLLSSALVYFFFMAAWLNFIMFVSMIIFVRIFIGLVAVGVGGVNIRDYWQNRKVDGVVCKVSKNTKTQKIFDKIRNIVHRDNFLWSILGILILGFSVNLVELACSAGFPAIYTQILAMSDLMTWQKYLYMFFYILFYMLDDLIVFIIAMSTLKTHVFGSKYAKYTNLISGILILILGLLLIFKPEWLMFS